MSKQSAPSRPPQDIKSVDLFEVTSGGFGVLTDEALQELLPAAPTPGDGAEGGAEAPAVPPARRP